MLKYNNNLIAISSNPSPVYTVDIATSTLGSVTALPPIGNWGQKVSLNYETYDPDTFFNGYDITGATFINKNEFIIRNSNVQISPKFYESVFIFNDNNTYDRAQCNINKDLGPFNYAAITFEHNGNGGSTEAQSLSINPFWDWRWHFYYGNHKPIKSYNASVASAVFTGENANTGIYSDGGNRYCYCTDLNDNTLARFKLIVDLSGNVASAFWNNIYYGYGNVLHNTTINYIKPGSDQGYANKISGVNIASFKYLEDAVNWYGSAWPPNENGN